MSTRIITGDCLEALPELAADSIDACVTDPPYHLTNGKKGGSGDASVNPNSPAGRSMISTGFMGKRWDGGDVAFQVETWRLVLRVLKPGSHLLAFGGTRTYHRMVCAIEDAGFEVRDCIQWLYGSGFPKSHDVSKGIDRAAGAEREIIDPGTPVKRMIPGADQNKQGWEKNNGREYVPGNRPPATDGAREWSGWGTALKPACELIVVARKPLSEKTIAANVLKWGTGAINIDGCRVPVDPEADASQMRVMQRNKRIEDTNGQVWGMTKSSGDVPQVVRPDGRWPANIIHDGSEEAVAGFPEAGAFAPVRGTEPSKPALNVYGEFKRGGGAFHNDHGSAARFFYTAKADSDDRLGSKHPTVKPVDLIAYLCRLVTPPKGTVLDPFAGSGTTGMACLREGFDCVLIELEAEYVADIKRRIEHVSGLDAPLFAHVAAE